MNAAKASREFFLQIHITEKCQYRCPHCYLGCKTKQDMAFVDFKKIIDKFILFCDSLGASCGKKIDPVVHITGGDPLLHNDIYNFLEYVNGKAKIGILGNPDLLNSDTIEKLKTHGVKSYQISIDGPRNIHDTFRGSVGAFDKSVESLKELKRLGIRGVVMYNVTNKNIKYLTKTFKIVGDIAHRFAFARVVGPSYNRFNSNKYRKEIVKILKTESKYNAILSMKEPLISTIIDQRKDLWGGCAAGVSLLTIDSTGNMYACSRLPIRIGDAFNDDFFDIFINSPVLNNLRFSRKCSGCNKYNQCKGCAAVSYYRTGNYLFIDPDCIYKTEEIKCDFARFAGFRWARGPV